MKIADRLSSRWRRARSARRFRKRFDVLNAILARTGGERYLEIGVHAGRCFHRVEAARKTGVDPRPRLEVPSQCILEMASDAFFESSPPEFDLVFVDGLHLAEQALRDVLGALRILRPGGLVVLHDCDPPDPSTQCRDDGEERIARGERWNGDVWKVLAFLEERFPRLMTGLVTRDEGLGLILPGESWQGGEARGQIEEEAARVWGDWTWETFLEARSRWKKIDSRALLETFLRGEPGGAG